MIICKFNYFNLLTILNCLVLFLQVNSITFYYYVKIFKFHFDFLILFFNIYIFVNL